MPPPWKHPKSATEISGGEIGKGGADRFPDPHRLAGGRGSGRKEVTWLGGRFFLETFGTERLLGTRGSPRREGACFQLSSYFD